MRACVRAWRRACSKGFDVESVGLVACAFMITSGRIATAAAAIKLYEQKRCCTVRAHARAGVCACVRVAVRACLYVSALVC